jgi:diaminohydroxyphosphoribosylaminopyrimidine deaminase/5-amino-6-(5-phosphoribosylamino)uracil reductase
MRRALVLARRGWGQTAPNPMVGAVVVRDGAVVGEGYHVRFGEAHAEVNALAAAGDRARGSTLVVTLEPCNHHGKTPPCSEAAIAAGVRRVVCAVRDPGGESGGGAKRLRAAGIDVEFGPGADEARELNAPFFFAATGASRPWVTLKIAISVDGAIADASRAQRWLTGELARKAVHRMRANSDAIAVGIGTVLADDPLLTVRSGRRPRTPPLRVVFDRDARLPLNSKLAKTARKLPTLLLARPGATADALTAKGVQLEQATDIAQALQVLHQRGVRSLMVEGGAGLAGAFLRAAAVDRLVIFQAPVLLGAGALPAFEGAPGIDRLRVVERQAFGDDQMTVYALHE